MTTKTETETQNRASDDGVDWVNHPPHYNKGPIETTDAIRAMLGDEGYIAYCRGNAMKYIWRALDKGGAQDLRKGAFYLNRAAEIMEGKR